MILKTDRSREHRRKGRAIHKSWSCGFRASHHKALRFAPREQCISGIADGQKSPGPNATGA